MRNRVRRVALVVVAGVLALGLATLVWTVVNTVGTPNGMQGDVALGAVDDSDPTRTSMPAAATAADPDWTVIVDGFVDTPLSLTIDDIAAMPPTTVYGVLICVGLPTSPLDEGRWTGVRLGYILEQAGVSPEAVKVAFYADDGFTTDLPITTAMRDDIILAYERDGEPLYENLRLVVPCKWGYKWIRDLIHIELVDYDFLGHYESQGYSDEAEIPGDIDCDGVTDEEDNCESVSNPDQTDTDGDSLGDACDPDNDDDGILDDGDGSGVEGDNPCSGGQTTDCDDNCPVVDNEEQTNTDADLEAGGASVVGDALGDACDDDDDSDEFSDDVETYLSTVAVDNCVHSPPGPGGDAWPLDNNVDRSVTVVGDVLNYVDNIGLPVDGAPILQRLDLSADGSITTVGDVLPFSGNIGAGCT